MRILYNVPLCIQLYWWAFSGLKTIYYFRCDWVAIRLCVCLCVFMMAIKWTSFTKDLTTPACRWCSLESQNLHCLLILLASVSHATHQRKCFEKNWKALAEDNNVYTVSQKNKTWKWFLFHIAANGWIGTHNILYRSNTRNAMIEYAYTNNSKLICMNMNNVIGLIIMEQTMRNERVPKFYSSTWQWLKSPSLAQSAVTCHHVSVCVVSPCHSPCHVCPFSGRK